VPRRWSSSRQAVLEALAPRRVAQLPAELPLSFGVGETSALGRHRHCHFLVDLHPKAFAGAVPNLWIFLPLVHVVDLFVGAARPVAPGTD
jgi:hypothetical protein